MRFRLATAATLAIFVFVLPAPAEEAPIPEGWQVASDINLTLTQNAYSNNWDGGETGALSWALNSNTLAESQLTDVLNSKNTLKLSFGQTHNQDKETKKWAEPSTTTDLIDFESVLRFSYGWFVDPFVSGRVESRFLDTRDPAKKRTLNPMTLTESCGVARVLIDEEDRDWTARLGGAIRQHIDRDALPEGGTVRENISTNDGGLEFVSEFRTPLADGAISLSSDLTIYKALYYSESDALEGLPGVDDWKSPDVNWQNTFSAGITDYIVVNLYLQLLYDKQIDEDLRLKETLSLGFTFKLL
ncbi:MAG: DUF3078 domain-containing protein [Candidatus Eisenbacteria bacterium]